MSPIFKFLGAVERSFEFGILKLVTFLVWKYKHYLYYALIGISVVRQISSSLVDRDFGRNWLKPNCLATKFVWYATSPNRSWNSGRQDNGFEEFHLNIESFNLVSKWRSWKCSSKLLWPITWTGKWCHSRDNFSTTLKNEKILFKRLFNQRFTIIWGQRIEPYTFDSSF